MSTSWSRSVIQDTLDIHGEMLFLSEVNHTTRTSEESFELFESIAKFDTSFFAFRDHLSQGTANGGPLPGVFLMECMAQTAAFGLSVTYDKETFLVTHFNVALSKKVRPGIVKSVCKVPKIWPSLAAKIKVSVISWQEDSIVGRGDLTYSRAQNVNRVDE
jgi:hypothetical protein